MCDDSMQCEMAKLERKPSMVAESQSVTVRSGAENVQLDSDGLILTSGLRHNNWSWQLVLTCAIRTLKIVVLCASWPLNNACPPTLTESECALAKPRKSNMYSRFAFASLAKLSRPETGPGCPSPSRVHQVPNGHGLLSSDPRK